MNFLSHAIEHLDTPWVAVGTAVPDWLSVLNRRVRARTRGALPFLDDADEPLRSVAYGVVRHHEDDRWFHGTRAFAETNLSLAVQLRDLLAGDRGFRPTFVGHILIEMLLDAFWIRDNAGHADRYYAALAAISPVRAEACVSRITGHPVSGLADLIRRFIEARFLYDYVDHDKLMRRLNQVMRRVGLEDLPPSVRDWLPQAAALVAQRRADLLTRPPADGSGRSRNPASTSMIRTPESDSPRQAFFPRQASD